MGIWDQPGAPWAKSTDVDGLVVSKMLWKDVICVRLQLENNDLIEISDFFQEATLW